MLLSGLGDNAMRISKFILGNRTIVRMHRVQILMQGAAVDVAFQVALVPHLLPAGGCEDRLI